MRTLFSVCDGYQYARIPLKIAEGVELAVGVYNLIYPAKKPYAVQLETATNQQVKVGTQCVATRLPHPCPRVCFSILRPSTRVRTVRVVPGGNQLDVCRHR